MLKIGRVREQAFLQRNDCVRIQCKVLQQRGIVKQILGQRCDAGGYEAHILELVEVPAGECSDQNTMGYLRFEPIEIILCFCDISAREKDWRGKPGLRAHAQYTEPWVQN